MDPIRQPDRPKTTAWPARGEEKHQTPPEKEKTGQSRGAQEAPTCKKKETEEKFRSNHDIMKKTMHKEVFRWRKSNLYHQKEAPKTKKARSEDPSRPPCPQKAQYASTASFQHGT